MFETWFNLNKTITLQQFLLELTQLKKETSVHYQKLLQNFSQNFSNSFCEVEKVIFYEKSIIKYIF